MSSLVAAERKISLSRLLRDVRLSPERFTIGHVLSTKPEVKYVTEEEYNRLARQSQIEKEQAYKDGYSEGQQMGYNRGKGESKTIIAQIEQLVRSVEAQRSEIYQQAELELVDLSIEIARRIIAGKVDGDRDIIIDSVKKAVGLLKDRSALLLKIAPEQEPLVRACLSDLFSIDDGVQKIEIVSDRRVSPGGCIVETEAGNVDVRIETELHNIETALRRVNSSQASE